MGTDVQIMKTTRAIMLIFLRAYCREEVDQIVLLHLAGFTDEEIGEIVGKKSAAVRKAISRAAPDSPEGR